MDGLSCRIKQPQAWRRIDSADTGDRGAGLAGSTCHQMTGRSRGGEQKLVVVTSSQDMVEPLLSRYFGAAHKRFDGLRFKRRSRA